MVPPHTRMRARTIVCKVNKGLFRAGYLVQAIFHICRFLHPRGVHVLPVDVQCPVHESGVFGYRAVRESRERPLFSVVKERKPGGKEMCSHCFARTDGLYAPCVALTQRDTVVVAPAREPIIPTPAHFKKTERLRNAVFFFVPTVRLQTKCPSVYESLAGREIGSGWEGVPVGLRLDPLLRGLVRNQKKSGRPYITCHF